MHGAIPPFPQSVDRAEGFYISATGSGAFATKIKKIIAPTFSYTSDLEYVTMETK
jgi:hypothetical protein